MIIDTLDKMEFCKLHEDVLAECPLFHNKHNTAKGRRIVTAARAQLGYSPKTASCDIYYNLVKYYRDNIQIINS